MQGTEAPLLRLAQGYQLSQALYVAAKLGLANVLAAGPLDAGSSAMAADAPLPPGRT